MKIELYDLLSRLEKFNHGDDKAALIKEIQKLSHEDCFVAENWMFSNNAPLCPGITLLFDKSGCPRIFLKSRGNMALTTGTWMHSGYEVYLGSSKPKKELTVAWTSKHSTYIAECDLNKYTRKLL